jgi:hypothetical protein
MSLQMHVSSRAKKLSIAESDLKLPVAISMTSSATRERDWANVVTAHQGDPTAHTWMLTKYRCRPGTATNFPVYWMLRSDNTAKWQCHKSAGLTDTNSPASCLAVSVCTVSMLVSPTAECRRNHQFNYLTCLCHFTSGAILCAGWASTN